MQNPVDMLYSNFWWSFKFTDSRNDAYGKAMKSNHSKAPEAFDYRVREKITQFLNCINDHPTVSSEKECTLWGRRGLEYSKCIGTRTHLLSKCVANITTGRFFSEGAIHKAVYYVHVRKWLLTVPRERIFFTTTDKMINDTHSVLREAHEMLRPDSESTLTEEQVSEMKKKCKENKNVLNYKTSSLKMLGSTRKLLEKFYTPFNELLS